MALAAAGAGAGSATAATGPGARPGPEWRAAMARLAERETGCYRGAYPALRWAAMRCAVAPRWPVAPALSAGPATRPVPATVGDGNDYSAQVPGLISQAAGTFQHVSRDITERGRVGNAGRKVANAFSLQLNSEFFAGPACSGSGHPAS